MTSIEGEELDTRGVVVRVMSTEDVLGTVVMPRQDDELLMLRNHVSDLRVRRSSYGDLIGPRFHACHGWLGDNDQRLGVKDQVDLHFLCIVEGLMGLEPTPPTWKAGTLDQLSYNPLWTRYYFVFSSFIRF